MIANEEERPAAQQHKQQTTGQDQSGGVGIARPSYRPGIGRDRVPCDGNYRTRQSVHRWKNAEERLRPWNS